VLSALNYMHSSLKITHRDIKLENILCVPGDDLMVKLTDFGFAALFKQNE
jgi:serine/threonine protein kinase